MIRWLVLGALFADAAGSLQLVEEQKQILRLTTPN
jgi:hypothetical protein